MINALKYNLSLSLLLILSLSACQPAITAAPAWHWERAERGLPRQTIITTVTVDPTNPKRLWAGAYAPGGLVTSRDGGQSWTVGADGLVDNPIFDLLAQPAARAGGQVELWAATRDGLRLSLDGGATWQPLLEPELPDHTVFSLATDASGRLYAGLDDGGVYAQTPDQRDWQQVALDEPLASAAVLSLAVSADGRVIYAGTAGRGVFATIDGGQHWTQAYSGAYAPNLVLHPAQPAVAVASLRDRLVRTLDGGQSWHTLSATDFDWEEIVSLLWLADGVLAAGTGQSRLYVSLDQGERWLERTNSLAAWGVIDLTIAEAEAPQILAGTWAGIYGSQDGGQSWRNLAPEVGAPNAQTLLSSPGGLYLGARAGLFRWEAEPGRWAVVSEELAGIGVNVLRSDPARPAVLYAGTSGSGLYRSQDAGLTWQQISTSALGITALAVDPTDENHLIMLAAWERAYESRDGGQSWQARWAGFGDTLETASLVIDPGDGGKPTIYVGAEWGLYRSRGNTPWKLTAFEIIDQSILTLLTRPVAPAAGGGSLLYIGATRGAYRSADGGDTIQGCPAGHGWGCGLEDISVTTFLLDPTDPAHLYAGTAYAGVYHSADGGQSWQPIGPVDLTNDVVDALAWGPEGELFIASDGGVWRGVRL